MTTDTTTDRAALAKALQDAVAARDRELPAAQRRVVAARKRRQVIEENYRTAARAGDQEVFVAMSVQAQLEKTVALAEHALRRSADPRIAALRSALTEHWDATRVGAAREDALALLPRIKVAQASLERLELAVAVDVDAELRAVLDTAGVTTREIEKASRPWG